MCSGRACDRRVSLFLARMFQLRVRNLVSRLEEKSRGGSQYAVAVPVSVSVGPLMRVASWNPNPIAPSASCVPRTVSSWPSAEKENAATAATAAAGSANSRAACCSITRGAATCTTNAVHESPSASVTTIGLGARTHGLVQHVRPISQPLSSFLTAATEKPAFLKPAAEEPAFQKLAAEEPAIKRPTVEEPAAVCEKQTADANEEQNERDADSGSDAVQLRSPPARARDPKPDSGPSSNGFATSSDAVSVSLERRPSFSNSSGSAHRVSFARSLSVRVKPLRNPPPPHDIYSHDFDLPEVLQLLLLVALFAEFSPQHIHLRIPDRLS